jgi:galactose mutarotase-like enzyme
MPDLADVVLSSEELEVRVAPAQGADILSLQERSSGANLLYSTPWAADAPRRPGWAADSWTWWMSRYPGGWQVLCPNAGPEREAAGTLWGFHGEASVVPWDVVRQGQAAASFAVELVTAPLRITRDLAVAGSALRLREKVTNTGVAPAEVRWVHHPAFGAPLIAEGARIQVSASTLLADQSEPGTILAAGSEHRWPLAHDPAGQGVELDRIPGPGQKRSIFGCLTDLSSPCFTIVNPALELGVRMRWSPDAFPHAWFWQDLGGSTGFPWYGRAHVLAIEPANVIPGSSDAGGRRRGVGKGLPPGESWEAEIELVVARGREATMSLTS